MDLEGVEPLNNPMEDVLWGFMNVTNRKKTMIGTPPNMGAALGACRGCGALPRHDHDPFCSVYLSMKQGQQNAPFNDPSVRCPGVIPVPDAVAGTFKGSITLEDTQVVKSEIDKFLNNSDTLESLLQRVQGSLAGVARTDNPHEALGRITMKLDEYKDLIRLKGGKVSLANKLEAVAVEALLAALGIANKE